MTLSQNKLYFETLPNCAARIVGFRARYATRKSAGEINFRENFVNKKDLYIILSLVVLMITLLFLGYKDMQRQKALGIAGWSLSAESQPKG